MVLFILKPMAALHVVSQFSLWKNCVVVSCFCMKRGARTRTELSGVAVSLYKCLCSGGVVFE